MRICLPYERGPDWEPAGLSALCMTLQVLQEMLDMLHEHENQVHAARLEIIVIWLIGETLYL